MMYVTKRNMANAVASMSKYFEQVSAALAVSCNLAFNSIFFINYIFPIQIIRNVVISQATKKHLTQRIENLDGKLDEQKEISNVIRKEVLYFN